MRGRTYWHSGGVKCQHAAEGRQRKGIGQMSMWLIHDKILVFFNTKSYSRRKMESDYANLCFKCISLCVCSPEI